MTELALKLIFNNYEIMLVDHIILSALYLMLQIVSAVSLNTCLISILYELRVVNVAVLLVPDALSIPSRIYE